MQIVIDISEEDYKILKKRYEFDNLFLNYYGKLIMHGTLLPKGHGRLIDADEIIDTLGCSDRDMYVKACIEEDAPTIIEADKEDK